MQVIEIFNYRDTGDGIKTSIQRESIVCALAKIIHSIYLVFGIKLRILKSWFAYQYDRKL